MAAQVSTAADVVVIFGITGDLTKKMTFQALYRLERRRMLPGPVVGVARDEWSAATLGGADSSRGSGIIGLKDRVEALGGTISLRSPPGHGTTLHVQLPAGPSAAPAPRDAPLPQRVWRDGRPGEDA
jgi:hypothetical protein